MSDDYGYCVDNTCEICKMLKEDLDLIPLPEITEASYEWDDTYFFIDNLPEKGL